MNLLDPFSFFIISDLHLGKRQYNLEQREEDFIMILPWITEQVKEHKPDFVLITGDLFDLSLKRSGMDSFILIKAEEWLEEIQRFLTHGIYAITGNHDYPTHNQPFGWLDYLNDRGFLHLLDYANTILREGVFLTGMAWDPVNTAKQFQDMVARCTLYKGNYPDLFTIAVAHAGLPDIVPDIGPGVIPQELFVRGRESVDVLALGHIHKPFQVEYAYNPGSPETTSVKEHDWPNRGIIKISVDDQRKILSHQIPYSKRRPFYVRSYNKLSGGFGDDPEQDIIDDVLFDLANQPAVVYLYLSNFGHLDFLRIREDIMSKGALTVRFNLKPVQTNNVEQVQQTESIFSLLLHAADGDKELADKAYHIRETYRTSGEINFD